VKLTVFGGVGELHVVVLGEYERERVLAGLTFWSEIAARGLP